MYIWMNCMAFGKWDWRRLKGLATYKEFWLLGMILFELKV